jgi:predicted nucleic acid-binding protein
VKRKIILDTGPLVALLNLRDTYHDWARAQFSEIEPPLLSCEAVISEACFLLRGFPGGPRAVLDLVNRGVIAIPFHLDAEADPVMRLLMRYASVPMALADACLVRMTEQHARSTVITLDNDFLIYRKQGRQVVPTIMPDVAKRNA